MKKNPNIKLRFNIITTIVYIIGIILLIQLFNLQIIHGQEYRETSNTRLTREATLVASRGSILDRSGNVIAGTKMGFSLELYKSKIDNDTLNNTILKIIQVLEQNGDTYIDSLPITIEPFAFNFQTEEKLQEWKQTNKIPENATAEDAFYKLKDKYEIQNENIAEVRKIMNIRYRISQEGYSSTKSIKIASNISRESAMQFNERNDEFLGVNVVVEAIREYPKQTLAAHIIGYIGKISDTELEENKDKGYTAADDYGKTGIEYVFEKYLKGTNGIKQIDMSVDGTMTEEYIVQEAKAGSDVVLTIDANLQAVAEASLESAINALKNGEAGKVYDSNYGAAVVMDVKTGEILAMASYPTYDPNLFVGGISDSDWQNIRDKNALHSKAIQGAYAPGSTFKMVTAIAALETGAVTANEKVNDTGVYPLGHNPVCWYYTSYHRGHGWQNITSALKNSCNYFFYEMGNRIGIDTIVKYAKYFGLGNKTGIELTGETSGVLAQKSVAQSNGETWTVGYTLSAAIGQSYNSFSPIQMVKYVGMLANGGNKVNPTIIKTIRNIDGTEVSRKEIEEYTDTILGTTEDDSEDLSLSKENIDTVLEGMRMVTESGGTAYSIFKGFNVKVGAKTGSAQAGEKTNGWFVAFAPFESPEIAISVMIEDGATGGYTGLIARHLFAEYFGMNANEIQENMTAIPYVETNN